MANKYYAVRRGKVPGIYESWAACKANVDGYPCAQYKSFKNFEEAREYLGNEGIDPKKPIFALDPKSNRSLNPSKSKIKNEMSYTDKTLVAYVDGSFNKQANVYGSGIVLIAKDSVKKFSVVGQDEVMLQMWNVAGEVEAAMFAIQYAAQHNFDKIILYYDYIGISGWASGWQANKLGSQRYKDFIQKYRNKIAIEFRKVKAHSGNVYNDIADELAKKACGLA